jgi:uncharacterized membrane protein
VGVSILSSVIALLPWADWLALLIFFAAWVGYATFARRQAPTRPSLLVAGQQVRELWLTEATYRDPRVLDAIAVQSLSSSPSFFASTTILIIGGLLAVLSSNEQATAMVQEIPFTARTSTVVFDLKVLLLLGIFVYAFFRFTWSLRQYNFGAMLVAAIPVPDRLAQQGEAVRADMSLRAATMLSFAAEAFNDGLRAYYMAFAAVGWFFSPWAFVVASAVVIVVLYQREFHSAALKLLLAGAKSSTPTH